MRLISRSFLKLLILGLFTSVTLAQSTNCPALVQSAMQSTATLCADTNTNEACYGNAFLEAQFHPEFANTSTVFTTPGDRIQLAAIQSLRLSPMDLQNGTWGMSLLEVQANLRQNVSDYTILLFGDVIVENAGMPTTTLEVTATKNLNVRLLPTTNSAIITTLKGGELLMATGRLADDSWIRVSVSTLTGNIVGGTGWIYTPLLDTMADFSQLSIVESTARHYQPMQAFFFETGAEITADCGEAPRNGILIQTPTGSGRIRLMTNGVDIDLDASSTAYLTAQRNGVLTIAMLQGTGEVSANGTSQPVFAGTTVSVPLNSDLKPSGSPTELTPYDSESVNSLPTTSLPQAVDASPPLSSEEIAQTEAQANSTPVPNTATGATNPNSVTNPNPASTPNAPNTSPTQVGSPPNNVSPTAESQTLVEGVVQPVVDIVASVVPEPVLDVVDPIVTTVVPIINLPNLLGQ